MALDRLDRKRKRIPRPHGKNTQGAEDQSVCSAIGEIGTTALRRYSSSEEREEVCLGGRFSLCLLVVIVREVLFEGGGPWLLD